MAVKDMALKVKKDMDDLHTDGYNKGYDNGYEQGSALKDKKPYINSINMTYWQSFFNSTNGNPIELVENCDFSSGENFRDCFSGQKTTITEIVLNSDKITNLMQPFYNCQALTKITLGNTSNCTSIAGMCNQCRNLVEILGEPIDMTNVTVAGSAFNNCNELVTVSFVNGSIGINVNIGYSSKLSLASAKSVLLGLKNYAGTDKELAYTITLHADTWALLDSDDTAPNGSSWQDYVSDIGWNS